MATRSHNFIVLSGEAGAGKDSVADILVDSHGYEKFSLSTEMKVFCGRVFGFSDDQLYGPSNFRNSPDPKWARPCPNCDATRPGNCFTHLCDTCSGTGKLNDNSPRRILQLLGDEWARQMIHPDIWTMCARPVLEEKLAKGVKIVINDARFDNDRANLAQWVGASLVDVQSIRSKNRKNTEAWRLHKSETERPADGAVHYVIQNDEEWPFPGLSMRVTEMLGALNCGN